jgi:hypothetical protein
MYSTIHSGMTAKKNWSSSVPCTEPFTAERQLKNWSSSVICTGTIYSGTTAKNLFFFGYLYRNHLQRTAKKFVTTGNYNLDTFVKQLRKTSDSRLKILARTCNTVFFLKFQVIKQIVGIH